MTWRTVKTPEDFKKYNREVFRKACKPKLWKYLVEKENEANRKSDNKTD